MTIPLFNNGESVPVYLEDDPQNIVHIKSRMTYADTQKCMSASTRVLNKGEQAQEDAGRVSVDVGAYNLLFLKLNVVRWEGPLFEGIPCTPENVERFNAGHPLLLKVLDEIGERNAPQGAAAIPNSLEKDGSISSKESAEPQPEITTSTSPSSTDTE